MRMSNPCGIFRIPKTGFTPPPVKPRSLERGWRAILRNLSPKPHAFAGGAGFTLLEVMVTTAVLSLGAVLIYTAFLNALHSYNYCSDYLKIAPWIDEKLWQEEDTLERRGGFNSHTVTAGRFTHGQKDFDWQLSYGSLGSESNLCKLDLVFSWKEGYRTIKISRTAYALSNEKQ